MANLADRLYWRMLIIRCQVGDRAAFEEMVGQVHPGLRGFLHKMLAGRQVDDVAQEIWIDVFRDLPKLVKLEAFFPWFYKIARNRAYRQLRRRNPPVQSLSESEISEPAEESSDFSAEDAAAVYAGLDRLSPEHREVLLLRFIEDMSYESYEDISEVIGCPTGTVRSRIYNAKLALRKILESERPS